MQGQDWTPDYNHLCPSVLQEPWILAVIAFHTVLLIAAVVLRNNLYVSGVILAAAGNFNHPDCPDCDIDFSRFHS